MPCFRQMSMWLLAATYAFPSSRVADVRSLITSRPYSDLPTMAPRAMAMGRPIIPVPGIPTPIAFFRMFADRCASIFSGRHPRSSVARATQSDTHIGSVQPTAGTTSRLMRLIICSRMLLSSITVYVVLWLVLTANLLNKIMTSKNYPAFSISSINKSPCLLVSCLPACR